MDETIILLDVDGTLVRLPYDLRSTPGLWREHNAGLPAQDEDWISAPFVTGVDVRIRRDVAQSLVRWHEGGARLMWLTSWFGAANEYLVEALGLPILPALHDMGGAGWKFDQARRIGDENPDSAIVWAEDEELDEPTVIEWAASRKASVLLAACDGSWGMSDEHIAAIDRLV